MTTPPARRQGPLYGASASDLAFARHLPDPSRRAAGQLAAAATRLRQPLNGRPTSILIADGLPVVSG